MAIHSVVVRLQDTSFDSSACLLFSFVGGAQKLSWVASVHNHHTCPEPCCVLAPCACHHDRAPPVWAVCAAVPPSMVWYMR
eukprot:9130568-Pyramimonas_sp.AAC.1